MYSVVIPVYEAKNSLERCVGSWLGQTKGDLELILVDDGSGDGSGELCDALAGQDARVRVIHQKNAGVSAARNAGMDAAQGRYLFFTDSINRFVCMFDHMKFINNCCCIRKILKNSFSEAKRHITGNNIYMICNPAMFRKATDKTVYGRVIPAFCNVYHFTPF